MPLDPRIILAGQTPDFSQIPQNMLQTAAGIQQYQGNQALLGQRQQAAEQAAIEQPLRMKALQQQVDTGALANTSGRQSQFNEEQNSVIQGSAAIKPLIDAGDVEGARSALQQRQASLKQLGLNTVQTDKALELLDTNPQQLKQIIDSNVRVGYQTGVLADPKVQQYAPTNLGKLIMERDQLPEGSPQRSAYDRAISAEGAVSGGGADQSPAAVKEFQYYQSLSDEDKEKWDRNKRGDRASTATEKEIFSAADGAQQAAVQFENYSDLASRYEQSPKLASGAAGSFSEWIKEQTGSQDSASLLRKDWAAVKASEVVKNLPPGAASDADVKMALAGFLPNNADPKAVSSFLRGTAKLAKINGEYQTFKADYLSQNKSPVGMLKAWKEQAKTTGSTMSSGNEQKVGRFTVRAE